MWPVTTAIVFATVIFASLVPIAQGVPRRASGIFTPDAEIVRPRLVLAIFGTKLLPAAVLLDLSSGFAASMYVLR